MIIFVLFLLRFCETLANTPSHIIHPHDDKFEHLILFGNSLTDDGLNPPYESYGYLKYSNGLIWPNYLCQFMNIDAKFVRNYAYSGAKSGYDNYNNDNWAGNLWQIDRYLIDYPYPRNDLVIYEAGGINDIFTGINSTESVIDKNIVGVNRLLSAGVPLIIMLDLVDISLSPAYTKAPLLDSKEAVNSLTKQINQKLEMEVSKLKSRLDVPQRLLLIHWYDNVNTILNRSFSETVKTLQNDKPNYGYRDIENYAFYDDFHPSSAFHQRLAKGVFDKLNKVPIVFNTSNMVNSDFMIRILCSSILTWKLI